MMAPAPWQSWTGSFSLPSHNFNAAAPINQLLQQPPVWQATEHPHELEQGSESDEELEYAIRPNGEGGIEGSEAVDADEDAVEDNEENPEAVQEILSLPHGLPTPPENFQPLAGVKHTRQWHLPLEFATSPRIDPPKRCTNHCCYDGKGDGCIDGGATDSGTLLQDRWDLPLQFFQIFFTRAMFDIMVSNTNSYAENKKAGQPQDGQSSRRPWKETSTPELMIWFGQILYMSVVRLTRTEDYWSKQGEWPKHCIMKFRGHNRFTNIKSFFHLSPPSEPQLPAKRFYEKVEPVASMLRANFQSIITPATSVSIDEIIVRFTCRSKHTIMMRGKPCPVGYNVLALCEAGYCYNFLFSSPKSGFASVPNNPAEGVRSATGFQDQAVMTMITDLSKTSRAVLHLMLQTPRDLFYVLYCDNLFSNVDLFHVLRYFNIAACGTARSTSKNWPKIFKAKIKRKTTRFPFNFQTAIIVHDDVCAMVWQDKNLVQFITSHHDPRAKTLAERKKPFAHNSSKWYRDMVAAIWGSLGVVTLLLPTYSVDYNMNMGGVDRHDQMRSYGPTQLISVRTWLPFFFFMYDAAIINAFLAYKDIFGHTKIPHLSRQKDFRMQLAWNLVIMGAREMDEEWTDILATGGPIQPRYKGKYRSGAVPKGNTTKARHRGYVGKH